MKITHSVLFWYLAISCGAMFIALAWMLVADFCDWYIHGRPSDPKFGYNYSSGLAWMLAGALAPFINLLALAIILYEWVVPVYRGRIARLRKEQS